MPYSVYKLLIDKKHFYIGCTSNTKKRHQNHMSHLKKGIHVNKHIQKLYDDNNNILVDMNLLKVFDNKKEAQEFERTTIHEIGDDPLCLNVISTSEHKRKVAESNKGKIHSAETRRKLSISNKGKNKGKIPSAETRLKRSEAMKGIPQPKTQCPHCGKIGGLATMHRHHFNNCKSIIQSL